MDSSDDKGVSTDIKEPGFWRAGAIATTLAMLVVLVFLTIDSLATIREGGRKVPAYDVINQKIGYSYDWSRQQSVPVIGPEELLFGTRYSHAEATRLMETGKLVIQTRNCMNCHTFFGNGAYFAPDLTKAWLDPAWSRIFMPMTGAKTREEAMVMFLMNPEKYPTWTRVMPNLNLTRADAEAVVAYLKWMSSVDTNGFPARFGSAEP
jgi:nitric oxide reductase subunit C